MGSVRKLRYKSGGVGWQGRWRDPGGIQRAKNFSRKTDADRYLAGLEADKLRLGHASIKTTLDTYGHLFNGLDGAAAERLDEIWQKSDLRSVPRMVKGKLIRLPAQ